MREKVVIEFDHHSPAYAENPWAVGERLAREAPVAWTNAHGGYWVVSGNEEIRQAARDSATFTTRHDLPNGVSPFLGINQPPIEGRYLPIEIDPPEQLAWRRCLSASFSQGAAERMRPAMAELSTWCIDRKIESGAMDFVLDLSSVVPALVTLDMLGLPLTLWPKYVEMTHKVNYSTGPELQAAHDKFHEAMQHIVLVVHERRKEPRDDLLTTLAQMEVNGAALTDEQIASACGTIVAGGIDTTSAVVAGALKYMGENKALRQRLAGDFSLMPGAVEEFLRFVSPVTGLARTAARATELGGQQIAAGERVLLLWHAANMDERQYQCPTQIDIDRDPRGHVTFGFGAHRCLGSTIAREDIPSMLTEVLARIPDYELVPGGAVRYPSIGVSNNYISIPVTFTPGKPRGISDQWLRRLTEAGLEG